MEGRGLQTGKPVKAVFYPSEKNQGIVFVRKDLGGKPPISFSGTSQIKAEKRRTRIFNDDENYVETVEHVLAALWAAEVDNIRIDIDNPELPVLDGGALEFLNAIRVAGVKDQDAERSTLEIKNPIWTENKESFLGIFPSALFRISYIMKGIFPGEKRQFFSAVMTPEIFQVEIAAARTLWIVPEGPGSVEKKAELAKKQGYGKGADLKSTLIIDKTGPLNPSSEFADEAVRHKVLDLLGDLYLLGKPLKGRVIAVRANHELNLKLVEKVKKENP